MSSPQPTTTQTFALLPLVLLGLCGFAFASKMMIAKAALDAGSDPFQLGVVGNFGAGFLLLGWLAVRREMISLERRNVMLYLALGIVSVALPTVLSFFRSSSWGELGLPTRRLSIHSRPSSR